jgi:hypothetical protein
MLSAEVRCYSVVLMILNRRFTRGSLKLKVTRAEARTVVILMTAIGWMKHLISRGLDFPVRLRDSRFYFDTKRNLTRASNFRDLQFL